MYHTLEAQKVLDDDSSKILLFFTSSTFNLSRQKLTVYHNAKVDELQPVQKEVVQSWLGPFIDFYFGSLALVLSRFMKKRKLNYK